MTEKRMSVQDRACTLQREPDGEALNVLDDLRHTLIAEIAVLKQLQPSVTGSAPVANQSSEDDVKLDVPVELWPIPLPSSVPDRWPAYCMTELTVRKHHACRHLATLHNMIAEKSCQYSHVI